MGELTQLLQAARQGDEAAIASAFAVVYAELRQLARAKLRVHQTSTLLDTTSLVHECFLRFSSAGRAGITDRPHFFAYASRVMRSVIVDFAREALAERRGGGQAAITLDTEIAESVHSNETDLLRVNEALEELAQVNPRLATVVEMRYFAGLTEREIAEALQVSERTVKRDWEKARLLLRAAMD
jgi:RNA polymerase sigma factor (TIGR02999 family)